MKKLFIITLSLFTWLGHVCADEFQVIDATIPQGGTATLEIGLDNAETPCAGFQFVLSLPNGVTVATDPDDKLMYTVGTRVIDGFDTRVQQNEQNYNVLSYNMDVVPISGNSGTIIQLTLQASKTLVVGTTLQGLLKNCKITNTNSESFLLHDELPFSITISEPVDNRIVLDEASATMPTDASGVDVRVKRIIHANEWSTLCLPFNMTAAQVSEAFGSDVKLATFKGWEATDWDDNDNTTAISVSFESASAITANVPYLIMTSKPITDFTVDGVDIVVDEPFVSVGKLNRGTFGSFTGSYVPVTIDEDCVFLSNNKLWYSLGNTRMKGYRGYFFFQDIIADGGAGVKIMLDINGATGIQDQLKPLVGTGVYDLSGRKLGDDTSSLRKGQKGVFIHDGRKVVVQ